LHWWSSSAQSSSFNPRPPCGGRLKHSIDSVVERPFQSAPPVRGAMSTDAIRARPASVSIRAPRAGGDAEYGHAELGKVVSIRAPRAGGDVDALV